MIVIRDSKIFCFNFDWPKNVDENLKHEIEFIITSNESLAENKKKDKTKNGDKVLSLEVVEVVLVQCNLVDNQYQQKSPNKSYAYLLNIEPSNLVENL